MRVIRKSLFLLVALSLLFICAACERDSEDRSISPTSSSSELLTSTTPAMSSMTSGADTAAPEQPSFPATSTSADNGQSGLDSPADSGVPDASPSLTPTDNGQPGAASPTASGVPDASPSPELPDNGQFGVASPTASGVPDTSPSPGLPDNGQAGSVSPTASGTPDVSPFPTPPDDGQSGSVSTTDSGTSDVPPASTTSSSQNTQGDEAIALTIRGDAVSGETTWTLETLQSMLDGYRECTYSTTNNWPSFGYTSAYGISLTYLLEQAGVLSDAAAFKFIAADGYYFSVTYNQIYGTHYSYSNHSASGSSGAIAVEPVVAWEWGDIGRTRPEDLRVFFGQSGPWEVNTSAFVKNLIIIEVTAIPQGSWEAPGASIADSSVVPAGSEFSFLHGNIDSVRIYYTLDGSEPDYNSLVYNKSTNNFQPQLIIPLIITENVTIRALAAGLGKEPSPVVTFSLTVED